MISNDQQIQLLVNQYQAAFGSLPGSCVPLGAHASTKKIYRLLPAVAAAPAAIALVFDKQEEYEAYCYFAELLLSQKVAVPETYHSSASELTVLTQDLGETTLYDQLLAERDANSGSHNPGELPEKIFKVYKKIVEELPAIQLAVDKKADYSRSFPKSHFNASAIESDFKLLFDEYLDPAGFAYDKQPVIQETKALAAEICADVRINGFMFRDFQSRNIMVLEGKYYIIDFQGARHGPVQYDVASLLGQSRANLPQQVQVDLIGIYLDNLKSVIGSGFSPEEEKLFRKTYLDINILRLVQTIGAYGRAGYRNNKKPYLQDIPAAVVKLKLAIDNNIRFKKYKVLYALLAGL